ncbi:unnamed protein product, partial [Didymodactylos carnosus]
TAPAPPRLSCPAIVT